MHIRKIFILLLSFFTLSCANPLKKACKELTNAHMKLDKAVKIAQTANEEAPELVSEGNVEELMRLRDSIEGLKDAVCILDEIGPIKF